MLTQVKRSLDNALFSANFMGELSQQGDEDYNHKPVSEIKRMFSLAPVRNTTDFSNRGEYYLSIIIYIAKFHLFTFLLMHRFFLLIFSILFQTSLIHTPTKKNYLFINCL